MVAALPEVFRLASFSSFKAFNPQGTGPTVGFGNLRQPLNPLEAFGIWPSGEFRITPRTRPRPRSRSTSAACSPWPRLPGGSAGRCRGASRRCPPGCAAATLVYLGALAVGTPYTQAKCLAIGAPLIMLISLRGLLSAEAVEGEEAGGPRARVRAGGRRACSGRSSR